MRANTKKKHEMGRRFGIVIGLGAAGVMALGAQTGAQSPAPTPPGQATPTCDGKPATIVGTNGRDDLEGTQGPDVIVGLGGGDGLTGGPGNDVICGGDGRDFVEGNGGRDTLLGQAGRDALSGGHGKDRCEGGKGNDSTYANSFSPTKPPVAYCEVEKSIEKSGANIH